MEINLLGQPHWPEEPSGEPDWRDRQATLDAARDHPRDSVRGRRVLVVGYGLQGEPTALCLRDSGADVRVALRVGSPSATKVEAERMRVHELTAGVPEEIDTVFVLIPDTEQEQTLRQWLLPTMHPGQLLLFAHGFVLVHGTLRMRAGIDVAVLAPHGPGVAVRERYLAGSGVAAQLAPFRDPTGTCFARCLDWAAALGYFAGGTRICSVKQEVDLDLFVEQVLLCGGLVELCRATYTAAVEAGYDPVQVYHATFGEIGNTAMLLQQHGPIGLYKRISRMAMKGSLLNGGRAIGPDALERFSPILAEIESGEFLQRLNQPQMPQELKRRIDTLRTLPPG